MKWTKLVFDFISFIFYCSLAVLRFRMLFRRFIEAFEEFSFQKWKEISDCQHRLHNIYERRNVFVLVYDCMVYVCVS